MFGFRSHLREESRRFILCRALSDHLVSGPPSLVTPGCTAHQQRNRAFAAEFLATGGIAQAAHCRHRVGEKDVEDSRGSFRCRTI